MLREKLHEERAAPKSGFVQRLLRKPIKDEVALEPRFSHYLLGDLGEEGKGSDFSSLVDDMLSLMRLYKTDIENAASLESYKRAA